MRINSTSTTLNSRWYWLSAMPIRFSFFYLQHISTVCSPFFYFNLWIFFFFLLLFSSRYGGARARIGFPVDCVSTTERVSSSRFFTTISSKIAVAYTLTYMYHQYTREGGGRNEEGWTRRVHMQPIEKRLYGIRAERLTQMHRSMLTYAVYMSFFSNFFFFFFLLSVIFHVVPAITWWLSVYRSPVGGTSL